MERLMATKQLIDEFIDGSSPLGLESMQFIDARIDQDAQALARAGYIRIAAVIGAMHWFARGEEDETVEPWTPGATGSTSGQAPPSAVLAIPVPPLLPRRYPKGPPPTAPPDRAIAMPIPQEPLRTRLVPREISRRFDRELQET